MNMQQRHAAMIGAVASMGIVGVTRNAVTFDRVAVQNELKAATTRLLDLRVNKAGREAALRTVRSLRDTLGYAPLPDYNSPDYIRWAAGARGQ